MSYGAAAALQTAIYDRLSNHAQLTGTPVFDAAPSGSGNGSFVLIGPEEVRDQSDQSGAGAEHRLMISVISDATGFQAAKSIAVVVSDALVGAPLLLSRGHLVSLGFLRASAKRLDEGNARRIDLMFRARIEG